MNIVCLYIRFYIHTQGAQYGLIQLNTLNHIHIMNPHVI